MKYIGMDVGSTTVKALVINDGKVLWQDYQRHNTRQAEKVLEFLGRMEEEAQPKARRADMEMLPERSEGGQER